MNQINIDVVNKMMKLVPNYQKKMQKFNLKTISFYFPSPKLAKAHNPIIYFKQIGKDEQIFSLYTVCFCLV